MKDRIVEWIREWFLQNGNNCKAVIGISGGKDSSVVAALCVEALGKDRVFGVIMPNVAQPDIADAYQLVRHLDIQYCEVPVTAAVSDVYLQIESAGVSVSQQAMINLPARIRMATLYAVSQSMNGRVANTCNLSEDWIGYSTRYGDSAGDFCPIAKLTMNEVKKLGYDLGLPKNLIEKAPSDGLCGLTDEDNFGFTYEVLDRYIRTGQCKDASVKARIDHLHKKNQFKLHMPPCFWPQRTVSMP